MNQPNVESIRKHLQSEEVQEHVQKRMQDARSKATVTISRAAGLFNFTESQLREWEKRGLLKTDRPALGQDGKSSAGHRQYSPEELDKLALIRELMDQGYTLSEIPQNIDKIWQQVLTEQQGQPSHMKSLDSRYAHEAEHLPIDKRVEKVDQETFWRYFVSQALRLSILLICEEVPDSIGGLVLPLLRDTNSIIVTDPNDLNKVGLSLIGWLGRNRAFYSFLDTDPSFEFPSDFRIEPLRIIIEGDTRYVPFFIVQRKARLLPLSDAIQETIQRLLRLVYRFVEQWQPYFDYGLRDWSYQVTNFRSDPNVNDAVLDGLTEMVIALGGKTPDGRDRWNFCNLFMPQDISPPLLQRILIVRARSKNAPDEVSTMGLSVALPGLTFRAYQSGYVIYRPQVMPHDLAYRELEESIRSAIALPIAGEDGLAIGSLYVASEEIDAFSVADQRALRLITRMMEDLLSTYQAYQQVRGRLADVIKNPGLVDVSFREFSSENNFINDVETFVESIHIRELTVQEVEEDVSFIAIDIDNQSSLATKLGDHVARNLSREVGLRILGQFRIYSEPELRRLYHLSADRFYLFLKGVPLGGARNRAANLHKALVGEYRIDTRHAIMSKPIEKVRQFELPNVTVRLGVGSYKYSKLIEVLGRYSVETAVAEVRALIMQNLDLLLDIGQREGGNCIVSWDYDIWGSRKWSPSEPS
jgi:DNA-binding transcriptional MerR regulator/GGDEF domain-containing protein/GAF domain-containing protein